MYHFASAISSAVEGAAPAPTQMPSGQLPTVLLERMQRYLDAANYLTIGQIYLQDNALLRESLRPEHIKPRLLGHWGPHPVLASSMFT